MDVLKDVQPVVTRTRRGWIATTPRDHSYRIGVTAASEDEARRCFARALDGWRALHKRALVVEAETVRTGSNSGA